MITRAEIITAVATKGVVTVKARTVSAIELIVISRVDGSAADLTILTRRVTLGMIALTTVGLASFTKHVLAVLTGKVTAAEDRVLSSVADTVSAIENMVLHAVTGIMSAAEDRVLSSVADTVSAIENMVLHAVAGIMSAGELCMLSSVAGIMSAGELGVVADQN